MEPPRGEAAGPRGVAGKDYGGGWQRGLDRHGAEARWGKSGSDMIWREKVLNKSINDDMNLNIMNIMNEWIG